MFWERGRAKMKSILKDALILFAITAIAGVLLAVVNEVTKGPIAEQQAQLKQEACQNVFSDATEFVSVEVPAKDSAEYSNWSNQNPKNSIDEIYEAYDASHTFLGYVYTITNKEGYGGEIQFTMGIRLDGTLNGVSVLQTSETVGLGLEAENVLVPQFSGKNVTTFTYTKNGATTDSEIDAISSATITTNAFVNGVNAGLSYFQMNGGVANE